MTHSFPTRRSSDLTIGQAPVGVRPRPVVAGDPYRKPQRAAQITQPTLDLGVRLILGRFDGAKAQVGGIGADLGEIGGPRRTRGSIVASRGQRHADLAPIRSEERRVGKEVARTFRYRGSLEY